MVYGDGSFNARWNQQFSKLGTPGYIRFSVETLADGNKIPCVLYRGWICRGIDYITDNFMNCFFHERFVASVRNTHNVAIRYFQRHQAELKGKENSPTVHCIANCFAHADRLTGGDFVAQWQALLRQPEEELKIIGNNPFPLQNFFLPQEEEKERHEENMDLIPLQEPRIGQEEEEKRREEDMAPIALHNPLLLRQPSFLEGDKKIQEEDVKSLASSLKAPIKIRGGLFHLLLHPWQVASTNLNVGLFFEGVVNGLIKATFKGRGWYEDGHFPEINRQIQQFEKEYGVVLRIYLSLEAPITVEGQIKEQLNMPETATHFHFVYPIENSMIIKGHYYTEAEQVNRRKEILQAIKESNLFPPGFKDLLLFGGYYYHAEKNWNESSEDSRNAEKTWEALPGGTGQERAFAGVRGISPAPKEKAQLYLGKAMPVTKEIHTQLENLVDQNQMCITTANFFTKREITHFLWLQPGHRMIEEMQKKIQSDLKSKQERDVKIQAGGSQREGLLAQAQQGLDPDFGKHGAFAYFSRDPANCCIVPVVGKQQYELLNLSMCSKVTNAFGRITVEKECIVCMEEFPNVIVNICKTKKLCKGCYEELSICPCCQGNLDKSKDVVIGPVESIKELNLKFGLSEIEEGEKLFKELNTHNLIAEKVVFSPDQASLWSKKGLKILGKPTHYAFVYPAKGQLSTLPKNMEKLKGFAVENLLNFGGFVVYSDKGVFTQLFALNAESQHPIFEAAGQLPQKEDITAIQTTLQKITERQEKIEQGESIDSDKNNNEIGKITYGALAAYAEYFRFTLVDGQMAFTYVGHPNKEGCLDFYTLVNASVDLGIEEQADLHAPIPEKDRPQENAILQAAVNMKKEPALEKVNNSLKASLLQPTKPSLAKTEDTLSDVFEQDRASAKQQAEKIVSGLIDRVQKDLLRNERATIDILSYNPYLVEEIENAFKKRLEENYHSIITSKKHYQGTYQWDSSTHDLIVTAKRKSSGEIRTQLEQQAEKIVAGLINDIEKGLLQGNASINIDEYHPNLVEEIRKVLKRRLEENFDLIETSKKQSGGSAQWDPLTYHLNITAKLKSSGEIRTQLEQQAEKIVAGLIGKVQKDLLENGQAEVDILSFKNSHLVEEIEKAFKRRLEKNYHSITTFKKKSGSPWEPTYDLIIKS